MAGICRLKRYLFRCFESLAVYEALRNFSNWAAVVRLLVKVSIQLLYLYYLSITLIINLLLVTYNNNTRYVLLV